MKFLLFPFLTLLCLPLWYEKPAAGAQSQSRGSPALQRAINLSEALTRVFERNPELAVSELEIQAVSARIIQAGLKPNPEFVVDTENFPAMTTTGVFHYLEGTLQMSQRLELGGKRSMRVQAAEREKGVAYKALEVKKNDLMATTGQAFAEVLADQERLSNQRELTRLARQSHSTVVDRVAAGKVSPVEQTRATVALASAELEEQKQLKELQAAKGRLSALWGANSADFDEVSGKFEVPPAPAGGEGCIESNPDLALALAAVDSSRANLALEVAEKKPDLTFSAGFRRLNLEDKNAWVVGISIPIPIFDRRLGAVAEAKIRIDKAFSEKRAVEWRLRASLAQARHEYEMAVMETSALTKAALPAAKEALDAVEEGYRLGKFEFLNLLDAQRTYAELQRQYIEAVAAGLKATIQIERLARCDSQESSHEN